MLTVFKNGVFIIFPQKIANPWSKLIFLKIIHLFSAVKALKTEPFVAVPRPVKRIALWDDLHSYMPEDPWFVHPDLPNAQEDMNVSHLLFLIYTCVAVVAIRAKLRLLRTASMEWHIPIRVREVYFITIVGKVYFIIVVKRCYAISEEVLSQ